MPLQAGLPVVEEAPRPSFPLVAPQLAEGLLQQVGRVEPLVGSQQRLQGLPAIEGQVVVAGQQDVFLTLDVTPVFSLKTGIFALSDLVQGVVQMAHHMKLVEQDGCLRRPPNGDIAKRLPHVHDRQPNAARLLLAQPIVELLHAGFRAILAAKPDRPASDQVAHHNPIGMPLADGYLVDADGLRPWRADPLQLDPHVLLVQFLDGMPIQMQFLGHVPDRAVSAAPADKPGKPLGVERIVGKEVESLSLHLAAALAENPSDLEFQIDPRVATGQIPNAPCRAVVPTRVRPTTFLADRFFERRTSVTTRAFESPKTPRTTSDGRKPANRYASRRRLYLGSLTIAKSCQFPKDRQSFETRFQTAMRGNQ